MATGSPSERALRLHWSPDSANLPVRIALEQLGMPYEAVRVDRSRGDQRAPAYLALNPQGLIPVLEDGELVVFETGAILLHLAERAGRLGPDGPATDDAPARANFLRWLFFVSNTLHAELRMAFSAHRFVSGVATHALRQGISRRVGAHLTLLDTELARSNEAGAKTTFVETYLACCVRWAQLYPCEGAVLPGGLDRWPNIRSCLNVLEQDAAVRRAVAAEAIPATGAFTRSRPPRLPAAEITGGAP